MYIKANVSRMFAHTEPWDVSNSQANLGDQCARLTWDNALSIAADHADWLRTPLADVAEAMRDWARDTGAWDRGEIAAWSDEECLALFAQNVAGELRTCLGADDHELAECVRVYEETDWDSEPKYPNGCYYVAGGGADQGDVIVQWYAGV